MAAAPSPSLAAGEKKHWWLTNKKMVERYVREAKMLIATQEQSEIAAALRLLEAALALAPRMEVALELKARSLLHLRRFKEVADMLQDYIPSLRMSISDDDTSSTGSSDNSSTQLSRERVTLLSSAGAYSLDRSEPAFKCFSVSDLKKKVMSGLFRNVEKEGQWRYSVLGQACCHLGLMEDAMVLLQTGKRLATDASRRQSTSLTDDIFSFNKFDHNQPETTPPSDSISHIKLLIRRRTAAIAASRRRPPLRSRPATSPKSSTAAVGPPGLPLRVLRPPRLRLPGCGPGHHFSKPYGVCPIASTISSTSNFCTIRFSAIGSCRGPFGSVKVYSIREIPGKLCSLASKIQQLKQRVAGRRDWER
ncbi:hypothetical protein PHJA_000205100 [Phtheirospermum japonicum]|uniref:Uncharacterized protein n=1 Tax=Phtheirospermum japonicum TaxID=374723 RepID=A0A830B6I7_9LAMI|nr:hypothetical protein PHJA_000205100 [Phtheirospermum japonicum]